jgi:NADPH2:quinone reductase
VVEAGPAKSMGAEVWGTGGDVGFTHNGTHAELIAVPVASLRRKPKTLSFDEAASVGVNYIAAWCGIEAAGVEAGDTILLIGAGGWRRRCGRSDCQALRRSRDRCGHPPPHPAAPIRFVAEKLLIGPEDLPAEVHGTTDGKGADVVFDLAGC